MKPGWLARGLESARKEVESWPESMKEVIKRSKDFVISPKPERQDDNIKEE